VSFPSYPKYKDSGVEWLGEVPEHWLTIPIKRLGRLKGGTGFPHEEQGREGEELPFYKVSALGQAASDDVLRPSDNTISRETADRLGAFVFPSESLVFAKVGAALLLGRIRRLAEEACIDNNMMGLTANEKRVCRSFLQRAMSLVRFDLIANPGAVPSLNEGQIGGFRLPVPPLAEQSCIASFLQGETTKIDRLVAEQQRLIELLNEKREAVVAHAITKGLNPNAPTKPSGTDWLGEVPAHWRVLPLHRVVQPTRRITYGIVQPGTPDERGRFMVRGQDYSAGWAAPEMIFRVSEAIEAPYRRARLVAGDLVMTIVGAGVGNVAVVPNWLEGANITQTTARIAIDPSKASANYMAAVLSGPIGKRSVEALAKGAAQPGLNLEHVRTFPVTVPPVSEQEAIAEYLRRETAAFERLAMEAERAISLLRERRTALISAAVTGKIDVRGLADANEVAA
jgi:type I restriction enzyme, S subunit